MNKYWKCENDFNVDTPLTSTKNMRVPPEFFFGVGDVEEVVMMLHIAFGHDDDYDDMMMIMMMMLQRL